MSPCATRRSCSRRGTAASGLGARMRLHPNLRATRRHRPTLRPRDCRCNRAVRRLAEILDREIPHRWREIQLAVEPRLHGVLVGRLHVVKMSGLQGANVARDNFLRDKIIMARISHPRDNPQANGNLDRNRRHRQPLKDRSASHRIPRGHTAGGGSASCDRLLDPLAQRLRRTLIKRCRAQSVSQRALVTQLLRTVSP